MRKSQDLWVCTTPEEMYHTLEPYYWRCVNRGRKSKTEYIDCTCTLDIETTNTEEDGFLYSIQFNIAGHDALFRYVEDFVEFVDRMISELDIGKDRRMVFYIHNLGYEHFYLSQILHEFWEIENTLLTRPKKPLYILFRNGIEFRDSLKLFQKSLARATEGLPHEKMAGDLDYRMYRLPDTPLSPDEWNYCVNDVHGLWEAIERLKREHGYNQATIPFTNTGMVLDAVNKKIRKDYKCIQAMQALSLDKCGLSLAYKCMAGGDTHGTRWRAGQVFENCNSYDLKSAHPSQQILDKFPSGKPFFLEPDRPEVDLDLLIESGYGWLGRVFIREFRIRPECPDPTISSSKCEDVTGRMGTDNGRILGAEGAIVYMDSNDYKRFREAYYYEQVIGIEILCFRLDYLPDTFRSAVLDFFRIKESLEDGPERVFAKICVNTIFGACAQKVVRDEYELQLLEEGMEAPKTDWETNMEGLTEQEVTKRQNKKLPFLWGLWTASLSRLDLWEMIKAIGWENIIYWDTDSGKYQGEKRPEVEEFNRRVREQCEKRGAVVQNRKGKTVYIGSAEDEHPDVRFGYRKFTFLHAKCYAAEVWNDKKQCYEIETTIAGVGKKEGAAALCGDISNLKEGLHLDDAGGLALSYHNSPVRVRKDWKRETVTASWIVMSPRTYDLKCGTPDIMEEIDWENIVI